MTRIKRSIVALLMVTTLSVSLISCRSALRVAAAAAVVGTVAAHTAIAVAAWYSLTRPVYIYPEPQATEVIVVAPRGSRVYVVAESRNGRWVRVRTADGREGWVRADRFYGRRY